MKNRKIVILLIVINIMLMGIICSFINKNGIIKENQIIKEMTETEYDNSINELNKSHEEYALQVENNKVKIATAITEMGVDTSENANIDTIVNNIKSISVIKDLITQHKGHGQGGGDGLSTYTVDPSYYGKHAIVFMAGAVTTTTGDNGKMIVNKSGLQVEKTIIEKLELTYGGACCIYEGILQSGTISCNISNWNRITTDLAIVVY